ncbi:MAG TPA: hypothetical protein VK892_09125 [Pyrinomonadaceae bacterium]|nr:hypothetical protein [Pyrinomonadaceae bacterium]
MYCSRCGNLISEELNFCSRCGERVNKTELAETSKKKNETLDTLALTTIFVGVGGLLFLVGLVGVLLEKTISTQAIIIIVVAYLAAWLGVCLKLLGQISKVVDANLNERKPKEEELSQPARLTAPTTAQLEEHREPVLSVTENTTKTLDEVLVERKIK